MDCSAAPGTCQARFPKFQVLTSLREGASILRQIGIKMQTWEASSGPKFNAAGAAQMARAIRGSSLRMVHAARLGHPGGDLSAADILAVLYTRVLRIYPDDPARPDRDRFILS